MRRSRLLVLRIPAVAVGVFAVFAVIPSPAALAAGTSRPAESICATNNGFFYEQAGAYWACDLPTTTPNTVVDRLASICRHVSDGTFATGGVSGFFPDNTRCVYSAP